MRSAQSERQLGMSVIHKRFAETHGYHRVQRDDQIDRILNAIEIIRRVTHNARLRRRLAFITHQINCDRRWGDELEAFHRRTQPRLGNPAPT